MGSLQSVNLDAMLRHTFIPDYTVRAITEVFYVRIKRSLYLAAKRATLMERAKKDTQSEDHFDDEVEKVTIFRVFILMFVTALYGHAMMFLQLQSDEIICEILYAAKLRILLTGVKTVVSVVWREELRTVVQLIEASGSI